MKVLKFGGSSVANAKNIKKVLDIVAFTSKKYKILVVVSAFGKTTNALIKGAHLAKNKNDDYKKVIQELEIHHFDVIKELIPATKQDVINNNVKQLFFVTSKVK